MKKWYINKTKTFIKFINNINIITILNIIFCNLYFIIIKIKVNKIYITLILIYNNILNFAKKKERKICEKLKKYYFENYYLWNIINHDRLKYNIVNKINLLYDN